MKRRLFENKTRYGKILKPIIIPKIEIDINLVKISSNDLKCKENSFNDFSTLKVLGLILESNLIFFEIFFVFLLNSLRISFLILSIRSIKNSIDKQKITPFFTRPLLNEEVF